MIKNCIAAFCKSAGSPSTEQLAAINTLALATLAAADVYVRTAYLAHNAIDRDGEVFDDAVLDDFARTLPGKGLFVRHPGGWDGDSGPGIGRWFAARVVSLPMDEARAALREPGLKFPASAQMAKLLEASFFIPRSAKNADMLVDLDAGVAGDVSIGFRAADRAGVQDASGNIVAQRILGPGEAMEGSLVWLGAQPGARVTKAAAPNDRDTVKSSDYSNPLRNPAITGVAGEPAATKAVWLSERETSASYVNPLENSAVTGVAGEPAARATRHSVGDDFWRLHQDHEQRILEEKRAFARRGQPVITPLLSPLENPALRHG